MVAKETFALANSGGKSESPFDKTLGTNPWEKVFDGSFYWGNILQKGNEGARS